MKPRSTKKKPTVKKMSMGGMNTSQAGGGRVLQKVGNTQANLSKLPTHTRNRMGYMKKGGAVKRSAK